LHTNDPKIGSETPYVLSMTTSESTTPPAVCSEPPQAAPFVLTLTHLAIGINQLP